MKTRGRVPNAVEFPKTNSDNAYEDYAPGLRPHHVKTPRNAPKSSPGASPRWLIAVAGPALIVAILSYAFWPVSPRPTSGDTTLTPVSRAEQGPPEIVPLPDSDFANASLDVAYVGSETCAQCHRNEAHTHGSSMHKAALSDVDPDVEPSDGSFFHAASGRHYSVYRQDGQLRHREALKDPAGDEIAVLDYPVRYLVGSGHHTRSYLVDVDGFLSQSPITWYASRKRWEMSPGYDRPHHRSFHREIDATCMYCHVGVMDRPEENYSRLTFLEQGIGCERCHGPGALHVKEQREGMIAGGRHTIVHPAKLDRALSESICAHCHLMGDGFVESRGRLLTDYRPGLPLSSCCVNYVLDTDQAEMKVVGHVSQMRASKCYQNSKTLTCITCHPGHDKTPAADRRKAQIQNCLNCHSAGRESSSAADGCGLELAERLRRKGQNDCLACHMPTVDTDIPHVAFTHHRIGMHAAGDTEIKTPGSSRSQPPQLVSLDDLTPLPQSEQQRDLGLAYFGLAQREQDPQLIPYYRYQAMKLLESAYAEHRFDPPVTAALSRFSQALNQPEAAAHFAAETLQSGRVDPKSRINSLTFMAHYDFENRRFAAARATIDQLLKFRRFAGDWELSGRCRLQSGDIAGAAGDFRHAIEINPFEPGVHVRLAEACEQLGDISSAKDQRSIAERLMAPPSR